MEIQNLIGLFLPPVIDFVNTRIMDARLRFVVSMLICLAVAVVVNVGDLVPFNPQELLGDIALVFAAAQTTYQLYWKRSDTRADLQDAFLKGIDDSKK